MTTSNITDINRPKSIMHGKGNKTPKIVFVLDSPYDSDIRANKTLASQEGMMLEKLMNRAGIIKELVYITYLFKETFSRNNRSKYLNLSKKRPVGDQNYDQYKAYLRDELEDLNPNIIVAVGARPLYALTGCLGITKYRGSVLESTLLKDTKVMPIIDPESALKKYIWQLFISMDLKKLKHEKEFKEIKLTPRKLVIRPDYFQSLDFLKECKKYKRVAFDIEVSHMEVSCISFSYEETSAISIPIAEGGRSYFPLDQEIEIWKEITSILEDPDIECVGQNVTFDATFLFRRYGIRTKNLQDTMVAVGIAYPDFPKGLDFITSMFTDMPYYKDDGKDFMRGDSSDIEEFWKYNARDSIVLMSAYPKLLGDLKLQGNLDTYKAQIALIEPLLFMTEQGIKMDVESLNAKSKETQEEIQMLEEELQHIVGRPLNLRSPAQLAQYFYGAKSEGGLNIPPYRKGGKPTTDELALTRLARGTKAREGLKAAEILLKHRKAQKMKSTYFDMTLDPDGRLRTSMNPVGTKTGRLSSSKNIFGTGANIQNQPQEMKTYMLPDEDFIAYEIDLSQAENRIVSYIAPEPKMLEAFENGIDIHSRTASYIFGIPENEISKDDYSAPMFGDGSKSQRFWGKTANHAFNYGQGSRAFALQMIIPDEQAEIVMNAYHRAYPGVRKYHNWIQDRIYKTRKLENLFGRQYLFLDRIDYSLFLSAYAFIPQSTIADIINRLGLIPAYHNIPEVYLINQVHDSLYLQIHRKHRSTRHAEILVEIGKNMSQPLTFNNREFVIPCDLKILPKNLKDGVEVARVNEANVDELARKIREVI